MFNKNILVVSLIGFVMPHYAQASVTNLMYNNKQHITHVGTVHSYYPEHDQYALLKNAWEDFLAKTNGQERCVILEHQTHFYYYPKSFEDGVQEYGDWGGMYYLAQHAGVEIIPGDPYRHQAFAKLAASDNYNKHHVQYAFFVYLLELYNRSKNNSSLPCKPEDFINDRIHNVFKGLKIQDLITLHTQITGRAFSYDDYPFYHYIIYNQPALKGYFAYRFNGLQNIRAIIKAVHIERDIATIALIKEALFAGKHVFIMYGKYHQNFHLQGIQKIVAGIS